MSISSTNANLQSGQWNYISFTYDQENKTGKLYINDSLVGQADNLTIDMTNHLNDITIGHGDGEYINAVIDDVSIYNTVYSDDMIRNLKNNQSSVDSFLKNKIVGYWDFNDFKHELGTFLDKSSRNVSATAVGSLSYNTNQSTLNNRSVSFNGSATDYITVQNSNLDTTNMSVSVLVRPSNYNQSIVSKPGVFDLKINTNGVPQLEIGNTPHPSSVLNTNVTGHFNFNDNIVNNENTGIVAIANNIEFADSYNDSRCISLNGTDSFLNVGELIASGVDAISMSMWVNLSNLKNENTDTTYTLLNMKNNDNSFGLDWNVSKVGSTLTTDIVLL